MVTKISLKQEAARLAVDIIINSEDSKEFTPLAEEIYDFLLDEFTVPDSEETSEMLQKLYPLITSNISMPSNNEETSEIKATED